VPFVILLARWLFLAELDGSAQGAHTVSFLSCIVDSGEAEQRLQGFFDLEHLGIRDPDGGRNEKDPLENFGEKSIQMTTKGFYQSALPWIEEKKDRLQSNYGSAMKRLFKMMQKLILKPEQLKAYNEQLKEYEKEGFISRVDPTSANHPEFYLPHHPVVREQSSTTKIRPVFDASARDENGLSLNDCLHTGLNLNPEILAVLLRFRVNKVAWIGDIEKAFLQIAIRPEDRGAARFLWFEDPFKHLQSQIIKLQWNVVTFGLRSSPFILRATIKKHLQQTNLISKEEASYIEDNLYVDDLLAGSPTAQEAFEMIEKVRDVFKSAGMNLRKFVTNSPALRKLIGDMHVGLVNGQLAHLLSGAETSRVLGLIWHPEEDCFHFDPSAIIKLVDECREKLTKRKFLSLSSMLFDPLGLIAPIIIVIKILFQKIWERGIGWDDEVPNDLKDRWLKAMEGLAELHKLMIPRCYFASQFDQYQDQIELHLFCDASEQAYATAAYVRIISKSNSKIHTSLMMCRTRVAPLKKMTLPRLELLGAMLSARVGAYIREAIPLLKGVRFWYWTDSSAALGWIRGEAARWKPFIRNRIDEIRRFSRPEDWHHCPGVENPADLPSRGVTSQQFIASVLYQNGPDWLRKSMDNWPLERFSPHIDPFEFMESVKDEQRVSVLIVASEVVPELMDLRKFSSLGRALRVTAWVLRFIRNCRRLKDTDDGTESRILIKIPKKDTILELQCLSATEIRKAEEYWIQNTQSKAFKQERRDLISGKGVHRSSPVATLRPLLSADNQIIRVTGRVEPIFGVSYEPLILLPAVDKEDYPFVKLLIKSTHQRLLHAGVDTVLAEIRERFWIIRGRQQVKKILHLCRTCISLTSGHHNEAPSSVPIERLAEADAFKTIGLDFAGPVYIRNEFHQFSKAYICLFTCTVTRAIHLELTSSLSADDFIMALRRFFGRRRVSNIIYSDNAKTFKKTARQFKSLISNPQLSFYLADQQVQWRFIPNRAPWWGGFYERMVRSIKDLLKRSLGRASLTFDQMRTLVAEVEGVLNSRPLYYAAEDKDAPKAISPSFFLIGQRTSTLPNYHASSLEYEQSSKENLVRKERYRRTLLSHIWNQWRNNYLMDLRRFAMQNPRKTRLIKEGDVVLIKDAFQPRLLWKHGIVTKLIQGRDKKVRLVDLKTSKGFTNRSIQCLYPTELNCIEESSENTQDIQSSTKSSTKTQIVPPCGPFEQEITATGESLIEPQPSDGSRGEYVGKGSPVVTGSDVNYTTRSGRTSREPSRLGIEKNIQ